jgi:hypothetical protein
MQTIIRKYGIVFSVFILSLSACASLVPDLFIFPTPTGGIQYFFPIMEWKGDSKDIGAAGDITYRHETGFPGTYNITFSKPGTVLSAPSAITLTGDGVDYTLTNIEILFSEDSQTRITSQIDGDALFTLLKAQSISLTAVLDGTEYRFTPPKVFYNYRDKFAVDAAARPGR